MESKRKKWTAKQAEDVTESVLKFREKRRWQLAFRRYIIEKNLSQQYAPYFGLDIESYREWIALQFTNELSWDNFGSHWQFDHIIPVTYFDFDNKEDLLLCWNFINIRVEKIELNKTRDTSRDVLAAKSYFSTLYQKTGFDLCRKMVEKIIQLEATTLIPDLKQETFIIDRKDELEKIATLSSEDFVNLNQGTSLADIYLEREILRKFG